MKFYFCELLFLQNFIFVTQGNCYERYNCHMDSCAISPPGSLVVFVTLVIVYRNESSSHLSRHTGPDPGFSVGGGRGPILGGGGVGLQRGLFSVKMYAKTKELGPVGGRAPARPLDLPMTWQPFCCCFIHSSLPSSFIGLSS